MAHEYLTLTEAADRYPVSREQLRRLVDKVVRKGPPESREQILPNPEEHQRCRELKRSMSWTLTSELVESHFGPFDEERNPEQGSQSVESQSALLEAKDQTIAILQKELDSKDQVIARNQDAIEAFGQRIREANVLLQGEQAKLKQVPQPILESIEKGKVTFLNKHRYISNAFPWNWPRNKQRSPAATAGVVTNARGDTSDASRE